MDASRYDSGGIALDALLLMAGLLIVGVSIYQALNKSRVVSDSVAVEATIEEARVTGRARGPTTTQDFEPEVTYRYTYEGQTYTSSSLHPGSDRHNFSERADAKALADYTPGQTVTAHVLPSDPATAYLEKHPSQKGCGFGIGLGVGGVFFLLGLAGVIGGDEE